MLYGVFWCARHSNRSWRYSISRKATDFTQEEGRDRFSPDQLARYENLFGICQSRWMQVMHILSCSGWRDNNELLITNCNIVTRTNPPPPPYALASSPFPHALTTFTLNNELLHPVWDPTYFVSASPHKMLFSLYFLRLASLHSKRVSICVLLLMRLF